MAAGRQQYAAAVLKGIGAPVNPKNVNTFIGWANAEGGDNWTRNNPLNTTEGLGATSTINSAGVKGYPTTQAGIQATVKTLRNGDYGGIIQAFRSSNPGAVGRAVANSPWGTGALAEQTIAAALGQPVSRGLGKGGVPSGGGGGAAGGSKTVRIPGLSVPVTTQKFDSKSFAAAQAQAIAGNYLANEVNPYKALEAKTGLPSLSGTSNPLLSSGALTTTDPNPLDYMQAQTTLQKLAGSSVKVVAHPNAAGAGQTAPNGKITSLKGITPFMGKPVADWIIPILKYAKAHGWQGSVNSGYRSDAEQTQIYDSGVRPAAVPRSLGGKGSNHEGKAFPAGAVDVSDAQQLSDILLKSPYAKLLVYAGAKDPVHFSHPHDGGY